VYTNNSYQKVAFLNSANAVSANVYEQKYKMSQYLSLKEVNEELMDENTRLKSLLNEYQKQEIQFKTPLLSQINFSYKPAYVINNSFNSIDNYLTINKGLVDGIKPGMGIISARGIVGQVKSCSNNFSTAYSVLHGDINVSSMVKKSKTLCTTRWERTDYTKASLLFIPQHIPLAKGDTIITSGFNSIFPEGIMIGKVAEVSPFGKNNFQQVSIELSVDFTSISYVYVVQDKNAVEKDSLEKVSVTPIKLK
jgi:rod shape-determining protein MreC